MQLFGIVSLLMTIALVAMWLTYGAGPAGTTVDENGERQEYFYQDAVNLAREAADSVGSSVSGFGKKVTVYNGVLVAVDTKVLDLSGKSYEGSLQSQVRQLTNLRELNLSDNNFTGLPAEVGHLAQLEVLNLANNPFTGLPNELANLKNLRVLDLRETQYSEQDLAVIKAGLPSSTQILID